MGSILNLLFPRKCVLCQKLLSREESAICPECDKEHPFRSPGKTKLRFIDSWYTLWNYREDVRESIHRYKFSGRQNYAGCYGQLLARNLPDDAEWDVITWVPVSRRRSASRGYDQGKLLAQALSRELEIPERKLLWKIRNTVPQSSLQGEASRRANIIGAYICKNESEVSGKRILIVDDVLTTGATACECAKVLRIAGAESVSLATVAAAARIK